MAEHSREIDVDDLRFHVRTMDGAGGGGHPTFVLLHGIGMSQRSLRRLQEQLARQHTVLAVDLPGFAHLPVPEHPVTVETMAAGLAKALDRLGVADAVVVGHSMGAQWAVELGRLRPESTVGVVAIGPVVDDRHRTLFAQMRALALDTLVEPPSANLTVLADYLRAGTPWYLRQAGRMIDYRIEERVAGLAAPLLVIRGGRDPISGLAWCRRLRDRAPRGSLVIVPAGAHNVQLTATPAVADAIATFAARLAPADR